MTQNRASGSSITKVFQCVRFNVDQEVVHKFLNSPRKSIGDVLSFQEKKKVPLWGA